MSLSGVQKTCSWAEALFILQTVSTTAFWYVPIIVTFFTLIYFSVMNMIFFWHLSAFQRWCSRASSRTLASIPAQVSVTDIKIDVINAELCKHINSKRWCLLTNKAWHSPTLQFQCEEQREHFPLLYESVVKKANYGPKLVYLSLVVWLP